MSEITIVSSLLIINNSNASKMYFHFRSLTIW